MPGDMLQLIGSYQSSCVRVDKAGKPQMWVAGLRRLLLLTRQCRRRDLMSLDWAAPEIILGLKYAPQSCISI